MQETLVSNFGLDRLAQTDRAPFHLLVRQFGRWATLTGTTFGEVSQTGAWAGDYGRTREELGAVLGSWLGLQFCEELARTAPG
jgi:hypothetical protein